MNATELRSGIPPAAHPSSPTSVPHELLVADLPIATPHPCSVEDDGGIESMRSRLQNSQVAQCGQRSPESDPDPWLDMP